MPDGTTPSSIQEEVEFMIRIACECYCNLELVQEAQHPVMNGALAWGIPRTPLPTEAASPDPDLVLIVADHASLGSAADRFLAYKQLGRPSQFLIYLQDEEEVPPQMRSGLILPRVQLAAGLDALHAEGHAT